MDNVKRIVRKLVWGLVWIGAGGLILLANHGAIDYRFSFGRDWPAILVIIGISELVDAID